MTNRTRDGSSLQVVNQDGRQTSRPYVARASSVRGNVRVARPFVVMEPVTNDAPIHLGDRIETGPDSSLALVFADGTVVTLGAGSKLYIETYRYQPDREGNKLEVWGTDGTFTVAAGAILEDRLSRAVFRTMGATLDLQGAGCVVAVRVHPQDRLSMFTMVSQSRDNARLAHVDTEVGSVSFSRANETTVVTSPTRRPSRPIMMSAADMFDVFGVFRDGEKRFTLQMVRNGTRSEVTIIDNCFEDPLVAEPFCRATG